MVSKDKHCGRLLLATACLSFLFCPLDAQEEIFQKFPSALKWFNQEIIFKEFSDPAASLAALDSLEQYARAQRNDRYAGWANYYRGYLNKNRGVLDTAYHYLTAAIALGENADYIDHLLLQNAYNARGNVFSYRGDTRKEMQNHLSALPHARASEDHHAIATTTYNIGKVLTKMGNFTEAIPYMQECLERDLAIDDSLNIALDYAAIANLHTKLDEHEEAIDFLTNAEQFASEIQHPYQYVKVLAALGSAHLKGKTPKASLPLIQRATEVAHANADTLGILTSALALSQAHVHLGNRQQAIDMLPDLIALARRRQNKEMELRMLLVSADLGKQVDPEHILQLARSVSQDDLLQDAYRLQIEWDKNGGAWQAAISMQDSLMAHLNRQRSREITQAADAYDLRIELSEVERALALAGVEASLQKNKLATQRMALGVGALVLMLLAWFVFRLSQKNKLIQSQKQDIEKAYREKDTLLREIHHRVKNNLQVISSLLSLQGRYSDNPIVEDAIRKGKDRVKSMSLIHQNLYQRENLTGVDLNDYLKKLFKNLFDSYNITPGRISLATDIEDINLDVETVIPIGLVVNELVSNALKYAFPEDADGQIMISLKEVNDTLELKVQDDGIGMPDLPATSSESFGFKLINTFKTKLKADLEIHSDNGTEVKLVIKKYNKVA